MDCFHVPKAVRMMQKALFLPENYISVEFPCSVQFLFDRICEEMSPKQRR